MVPVMSLWLPIALSAVVVFIVSSIIHMFLPYHKNDVAKVPSEDDVMAALRKFTIPPGDYMLPKPDSSAQMKEPAFIEKMKQGPVISMTVFPGGSFSMGSSLGQWFVYCLVIGVFAAYVAGRALPTGADYLAVFRYAGVTAFAGYALGQLQQSIWWKRSWTTTFKHVFDGLVYALFTAGVFGWLWPR